MRDRVHAVLLALALTLASAVPAAALILCEDCGPWSPPEARCYGVCEGETIRYCSEWLARGCPTWSALAMPSTAAESEEIAKERFLSSLEEEAAEAVEPAQLVVSD